MQFLEDDLRHNFIDHYNLKLIKQHFYPDFEHFLFSLQYIAIYMLESISIYTYFTVMFTL